MAASRTVHRRPRRLFAVVWTDRALADLERIGEFIAADDPAAARRWVAPLIATVVRAAVTPMAGRRVPELARDNMREVFRRTYRIVYRVGRDRIEVLTVFEGHQRFPRHVDRDGE